MKKLIILCLIIISSIAYSQTKTATTEDGKKVILKSDKTWEYSESHILEKRKITLEFTNKDPNKQFQVLYDAPDSNAINSGQMIGGAYNSGWKKSIYVTKMENQITLKVANTKPSGKDVVTLNIYVDDKLVKTLTEKTGNLLSNPATLTINLEDYK